MAKGAIEGVPNDYKVYAAPRTLTLTFTHTLTLTLTLTLKGRKPRRHQLQVLAFRRYVGLPSRCCGARCRR